MANLIGARIERKEDKKFLTGKGRYTADINLTRQTHAHFVRSPHARAKITKIDITKASKAPGVVTILTGEDLAAEWNHTYTPGLRRGATQMDFSINNDIYVIVVY